MPDTAQVNTSIYQNQANPLDTISKYAGLQNLMNQNRLFQQQFQTNLGLSKIYQEAIDPQTGTIDMNKVRAMTAGDPSITLGLPQAVQQSQQMQQQQLGITKDQIDLTQKRLGLWSNTLAPLAGKENPTNADVISAAGSLLTPGSGFSPQEVIGALTGPDPLPADGPGVKDWIRRHYIKGLSEQGQFNAQFGTPQQVQQGSQTSMVGVSPFGGVHDYGAFQQGMSPDSAATPVQIFNPNTQQPEMITKGQFAGGGTGMRAGGASGPGGPSGGGGGNMGGGMGLPAGPRLGAEAAANTDATAGAQQGVSLQQRADAVRNNKAILGNLEGALNQFTSGPGANWKKVGQAFVNQNLQSLGVPGINVQGIASQEEFNKQAEMLAQSQFQALGGTGTDKQLGSVSLTSPNSELSKLGNKGIIALLKGNEDAINIKNQAWQQYKQTNGPGSYGQFSNSFNQIFDPRVFQSQYLSNADKQKMLDGMSSNEKKAFQKDFLFAANSGWIGAPK